MPTTPGHCRNVDYCGLAAGGTRIDIRLGESFSCPECAQTLEAPTGPEPSGAWSLFIAGAMLAAALLAGGFYLGARLATLASRGERPAEVAVGPVPVAAVEPSTPGVAAQPAFAALAPRPILAVVPAPAAPREMILLRMQGSSSVGAVLAPRLAAAYLASMGDAAILVRPGDAPGAVLVTGLRDGQRETIAISVQDPDSGFAALARGETDIAMSARRILPAERARLRDLGVAEAEHAVALQGIAVLVNPRTSLGSLTPARLRALLDGSAATLAAFGGAPLPVHLLVEEDLASDGLDGLVAGFAGMPLGARLERDVATAVAADRSAVGIVPLTGIGTARTVAVSVGSGLPAYPTFAAITGGSYRLARRMFFYTAPPATNPVAQRFVAFAVSPDGQKVVEQVGLLPVLPI